MAGRAVSPVDEEDRPRGRREQPAREGLIDGQSLLVETAIAEQAIDALDAVLHEGGAAQIAPEVRERQFPAEDECLDDSDNDGDARAVDPRARPPQPAVQDLARVHAVLL